MAYRSEIDINFQNVTIYKMWSFRYKKENYAIKIKYIYFRLVSNKVI
jgi:hypothetical protein